MHNHWLVITPPLLILFLGFFTRRVLFSIGCGMFLAAFIATDFSLFHTISLVGTKVWSNISDPHNLCIFAFLLMLGIFVTLLSHAGSTFAYGKAIEKKLYDARSAETASLFLSHLLCIDDYFNSLMTGSVLHPLTDRFKIPRAKLAFLVDAMSAPLAIIIPFSSWIAAIIGFLQEAGINTEKVSTTVLHANPFSIYLQTLPFVFYSCIIVSSAWFIVRKRISFGKMYRHEKIAQETGNVYGGKIAKQQRLKRAHERNKATGSLYDFISPIALLFCSIIGSFLFYGKYKLFGGNNSLIEALQQTDAAYALLSAGSIVITFSILFFLLRKKIDARELFDVVKEGISLMIPSICIILFAWTFGNILQHNLHTGEYLAHILIGSVSVVFLPVMFFIVSALISFSIGSSWGTMAILFPIAIPLTLSLTADVSFLFPALGAILSGGVFGDHVSPISDTTVMSSTSTGAHHIDHIETQIPYVIPAICGSIISFLLVGLLISYGFLIASLVSLFCGISTSLLLLYMFDRTHKKNLNR